MVLRLASTLQSELQYFTVCKQAAQEAMHVLGHFLSEFMTVCLFICFPSLNSQESKFSQRNNASISFRTIILWFLSRLMMMEAQTISETCVINLFSHFRSPEQILIVLRIILLSSCRPYIQCTPVYCCWPHPLQLMESQISIQISLQCFSFKF